MYKIDIKPLSVNAAFRGRRFKTKEYEKYEATLGLLLPNGKILPEGSKIALNVKFGLSSRASDLDNCLKQLIDGLANKYQFNDNKIYQIQAEKEDVKKGQEYISFELKIYNK